MDTLLTQLAATSRWEALAVALGLAYLLLAVRRDLWCWVCAFLSVSIYLVLFARISLYMQVLLQVFYLAMAVYGFRQWLAGRDGQGDVLVARWPARAHGFAIAGVVAATALNGWILQTQTDSVAPYLDSFVTWGSVLTTFMVARRVIENWLYWIVVDSAAAWLYFDQGLLATTLLFLIYIGIVVRGYIVWRRVAVPSVGFELAS